MDLYVLKLSIISGLLGVLCPIWVALVSLKFDLSWSRHCVMTDSRGEVLVALTEDPGVVDKWFIAREDSQHSRDARLQKPDELIKIVQRYLQGLSSHKHRPWNNFQSICKRLSAKEWKHYFILLEISPWQSLQRSSVLARGDWEVRIWVGPHICPLRQLIDEDEWGASWNWGGSRPYQQHQDQGLDLRWTGFYYLWS